MGNMNNEYRRGRFTSSMVFNLIKGGRGKNDVFSAPGLNYIQEKNIERRMGTCLDGGAHTQALAWGNFMELTLYSILGTQYQISSKDTKLHPKYPKIWAGSTDVYTEDPRTKKMLSIGEIKCYQRKNFALYTDCILKKDTELLKEEFPKEYWQIVSNAIINEVEIGEAITYMPYASEAEVIKQMAEDYEGEDFWKYKFIRDLPIEDLPFLPDGGYYKNINKFAFIIPQEDIEFLTSRILLASELLETY